MKVFWALLRREWASFFYSPIAYVVMFFFLVLMGLSFSLLLHVLSQGPATGGVMRLLLGESLFFWLAMIMVVPIMTMRLFAEEKKIGTIETLMTAPVSDVMVVLAKYAAALSVFAILWAPTSLYAIFLAQVSPASAPIDAAAMVTSYVGIAIVGAFYLSLGLLASAMTRNQAVAAVVTFVTLCILFFWGFMPYYTRSVPIQEFGRYTSSLLHMMEFSRGVLDTRPIVLYVSSTAFILFVTVKMVESRKWRR